MQRISTWSVLVVYEEEKAREEAVRVCDSLVRRFWATANFDIRWLGVEQVDDQASWPEWTRMATQAHFLIVSLDPDSTLPVAVERWMESWVEQRARLEGAAIIGVGEKAYLPASAAAKFRFLRQFAHRARMDYLTDIPQQLGPFFPEETEFYTARADAMTKVMGQILSRRPPHHEPPER